MNALTTLYDNLSDFIGTGVDGIKYIDVDLGQLKKGGEIISIEYPAVLIKFENVAWKDDASGQQKGLVHLRVKIIYPFTEDFYFDPHIKREEVLTFMDLVKEVHDVIVTLPSGNYSKLYRINENHLESLPEEMKWVYAIDYQCNIWEDGSDIEYEMHDVDYDLLTLENRFFERTIEAGRLK